MQSLQRSTSVLQGTERLNQGPPMAWWAQGKMWSQGQSHAVLGWALPADAQPVPKKLSLPGEHSAAGVPREVQAQRDRVSTGAQVEPGGL